MVKDAAYSHRVKPPRPSTAPRHKIVILPLVKFETLSENVPARQCHEGCHTRDAVNGLGQVDPVLTHSDWANSLLRAPIERRSVPVGVTLMPWRKGWEWPSCY